MMWCNFIGPALAGALLWASMAFCQVSPLPGSQLMIAPVAGGYLAPRKAGYNDPVTGLSADGTFHLLSVRGPLTNQFPRT
jgi:hypothetical protein